MNILLVTSAAPGYSPFFTSEKRMPIGIGFLISVLKNTGHTVHFIDNYLSPTPFLENGFLEENKIDVVGIYANTICYRDTHRMICKLESLRQQKYWKGKIIIGGPHTSVALETIPEFVDHVVQGEGEKVILDILDGSAERVVRAERIKDLDSLPRPAWDYFVKLPYLTGVDWFPESPVFPMNTSRGCPFSCIFCSVHSIWGKQYTLFGAERIVDDIKYLIKTYGVKGIYFREDNFTVNKERTRNFCKLLLKENIIIKWACESRIDTLDKDLIELMHRAGCRAFYLGVESGSQRILDFLKKGITTEQIERVFSICRNFDIKTMLSCMVGIPTETEKERKDSIQFIKKLNPTNLCANIFVGMPNSELYRYVLENKLQEHIDDRGLVYLRGHDNLVNEFYAGQESAKIPRRAGTDMSIKSSYIPKLSVVMSVYNGEKYLRDAIDSILSQTFCNFEFIIIDDCSTDNTNNILSDYKDARIRVFRNTQQMGLTKSLNLGLREAIGEYVARMDADDISLPSRFEIQQKFLDANPACALVGSRYYKIDENNNILGEECLPTSNEHIKKHLLLGNCFGHGTVMFRRRCIELADMYNEQFTYANDYDLWLRLSERYELGNVEEFLYKWRAHSGGISQAKKTEQDMFSEIARTQAIKRRIQALVANTSKEQQEFVTYCISILESEIKRKGDRITALEGEAKQRDAHISAFQSEVKQKDDSIGDLEAGAKQRDAHIIALQGEIKQKDDSIRDLDAGIKEKSASLAKIYESRGWKALLAYYRLRDKIYNPIGRKNGRTYEMELRPSLSGRINDLMRTTAKKILPKTVQIKIKNALYHLSKFRASFVTKPTGKVRPPFISVVVPVYNHSQYLRQALEGVINQSYENFEVIAVDDCSSEPQVKKILEDLQAMHNNLRVYYNPTNMGISETLNRAIIVSKGDYMAFLDCDDYLSPEALQTAAREIEGNPEAGYFFSNRINVDEHGKELERVSFVHRRRDDYLRELLNGMFTDHLKIIAKKSFLETGLLDVRHDFAQDYDFALRFAARKPQSFHFINEFLYYHRVHSGQVSAKCCQEQMQIAARIRDQICRRAEIRSGRHDKKLSIIIISFYKREHTFRCIEAIKNTVHGNYKIILLDNASDAITVKALKAKYAGDKQVQMLFSKVNLGCSGGRREAISHATGDYIITLDNDIVVTDTWIEDMVMRIEQNPDAGGVCAKVVFPDGKIQYNGGFMKIDENFVEFGLIDAWKDSSELSTMREHECDWIAGGATLFRREVYDQVKLCKDFVNAYEDNDFSLNVKKLGYKLLNCPTAVVIHNHLYYDKTANTEQAYLAARYCKDGLKQSVIAFYRRHGLIIKDQQHLVPELKTEAVAAWPDEQK